MIHGLKKFILLGAIAFFSNFSHGMEIQEPSLTPSLPSALGQYHDHLIHVSEVLFEVPPLFPELEDFFQNLQDDSTPWMNLAYTDTQEEATQPITQKETTEEKTYLSVTENEKLIKNIYTQITDKIPSDPTPQDWENLAKSSILIWDPKGTKSFSGFYNFLRKEKEFILKKDMKADISALSCAARRLYDRGHTLEARKRKKSSPQVGSKKQRLL